MRVYIVTDTFTEHSERLRRYLAEMTKLHASAFHIVKVGEIPKSESGKVLYTKLDDRELDCLA